MTTPSLEPGKSGAGAFVGGWYVGSCSPLLAGLAGALAGAVVAAGAGAVVGAAAAAVGLAAGAVGGALVAAGGGLAGLQAASSAETPTRLVPITNCRRLSMELTNRPSGERLHP